MNKTKVFIVLVLLVSGITYACFRYGGKIKAIIHPPLQPLTLAGNVDDRQVNLAFMVPERIAEIKVEEGDIVKKGDLLGSLETVRIENRIAEATAVVRAAQASLEKAINGYRKEEIAMAQAGVNVIKAQINAAENKYKRNKKLVTNKAVSEQDADNSEADYQKLLAELDLAKNNLDRMMSGNRPEDIAAARAKLEQANAQLVIQQRNLTDTKLYSPCDGIVRNRILEPGEMASTQTTAIILAIVSPKWIRVYLSEPLLTKVKSGDKAQISVDGLDGKTMEGWVGYISPNAEFTPKNVETKELRTSLVYEVRVYVADTENILKLGGPARVTFPEILVRP
ncbi:MAG: efflux RND transporter periplasmic adaptor subunit [Thermoguttaceae bacterium]|nr:efflux RND transporter periplasmic adaptor subunit [Thermoguttaceae bacterium]